MKLRNKDGIWKFSENFVAYSIPSRLYPIYNGVNAEMMNSEGFSEITDKKILQIINSVELKLGRCYENCNKVQQYLERAGYSVEYYSGWLFLNKDAMPVHHAWLVLREADKKFLIDTTDLKLISAVRKKLDEMPGTDANTTRENYKKLRKEESKRRSKNTDRIITGVPVDKYIYIGVKNTFEDTVEQFKELAKIQNHPSYTGGMNLGGDSKLQQEMKT